MAPVTQSLRVQGVALPDVTDWDTPLPAGKWSQFFKALAERVTLVGVTRPSLSHAWSRPSRWPAPFIATAPSGWGATDSAWIGSRGWTAGCRPNWPRTATALT